MGGMSRLRRWVVSDRGFFVTCRVLPRRRILSDKVGYIHLNPVKAGRARRPEDWP
jgi:REP element-mobilizing transposase RayT